MSYKIGWSVLLSICLSVGQKNVKTVKNVSKHVKKKCQNLSLVTMSRLETCVSSLGLGLLTTVLLVVGGADGFPCFRNSILPYWTD